MIDKYSQFLTQKLLLESKIKYSNDFRNILLGINDPVSKTLSSLENQDIKTNINFIDILKDDKEQLSFIQDKKASTLLSKLKNEIDVTWNAPGGMLKNIADNEDVFSALGYTRPESGTLPRPTPQTRGQVLKETISPKSGKTYVLVRFDDMETVINKEFLNFVDRANEIWTQSGRQPMRVGRAVTALLQNIPIKHTAVEIADFVNRYKTKIDELNDIFRFVEVVSGDDIAFWYHKKNYEPTVGKSELHQSCMSSMDEDTFQIYTKNPDKCKLIIQKSESNPSKIKARALLWTLKNGDQFMDRVYFNDPQSIDLFRSYCKENNFYCKYYNTNGDSPSAIDPSNGERKNLSENMVIILRKFDYTQFPYMDTFKYYNPSTSNLKINEDGDSRFYKLEDTGGYYIIQDESECNECGGSGHVECWECNGRGSSGCPECNSTGFYTDDDGNEMECVICEGSGRINCDDCNGRGSISCQDCRY